MIKEIWKDIKDYEGLYQVSNLGRVKSLDKIIENQYNINNGTFTGKRIVYGKILKPCISNTGYYQISLSKSNNKREQKYIHRLVAEAFVPNPDNLPIINHKDENKLNNRCR